MKGLIVAKFLDRHFPDFPDLDSFDLLAGTSTGGILALGIEKGMSPAQMVDYYLTHGPAIFRKGPKKIRLIKRDRYSAGSLEKSLRETLGTKSLKDVQRPVLIPSLDWTKAERQDSVFFFHEERPYSCFDAAMATSAAPTYFPAYVLDGLRFVDGGICCNNPAVAAMTRARKLWPDEELEVWSIGTGREPGSKHRYPWTALALFNDVFELAMAGSAGVAHAEMKQDRSVGYVRYEFNLGKAVQMDDSREKTLKLFLEVSRNPVKRADTRKERRKVMSA